MRSEKDTGASKVPINLFLRHGSLSLCLSGCNGYLHAHVCTRAHTHTPSSPVGLSISIKSWLHPGEEWAAGFTGWASPDTAAEAQGYGSPRRQGSNSKGNFQGSIPIFLLL